MEVHASTGSTNASLHNHAVKALANLMTATLNKENILKVMLEKIPKLHEENKKAFEMGYSLGRL
jgi:Pyruvate/2-oxoacid:ferredoxin oxidoreductase gamma subunit